MTDSSVALAIWLVALQMILYAAAWGVCAALLRESRAAMAQWGGFLLLLGVGLALGAGRGEPREWVYYNGSNLATLAGFALMRRGTERFMRVPTSDREQWLVLAPLLALIAWAGPGEASTPLRLVCLYAGQGYCVLRTIWTVRAPLRREFGAPAAAALLLPCAALGISQALLAAAQLAHWPLPLETQRDPGASALLMALYLGASAVFNIGFMALLTMRLVSALREATQIDSLTGLYNRRAIRQALDHAWAAQRRTAQPLALLAVDIDHFKQINDGRGQAAADQVLIGLAALLQRQVRAVDVVGRLGGDEYLVLLPGADGQQALTLAERLRQAVPDAQLGITVSIGVAQALRSDHSIDMAIARADQALRQAKAGGRNRVETIAPEPAPPAVEPRRAANAPAISPARGR